MKKKYTNKIPLIIEKYPKNYKGYPFITLIRYNDDDYLNIVDNKTDKQIVSYVLDLCNPNNVKEEKIIEIANNWYYTNKENYPISVEFSKLGMVKDMSKIIRSFHIDYVTRVIGPLPEYNLEGPAKIRKRKRKTIPKNIELIIKPLDLNLAFPDPFFDL